jgi:hypothetical protein
MIVPVEDETTATDDEIIAAYLEIGMTHAEALSRLKILRGQLRGDMITPGP